MAFDSKAVEGSLAWLMSKEPLRTRPVGTGSGRTAAEIARAKGLEKLIVAHETKTFLAYESITRSRAGIPNFFVSRPEVKGEVAAHGWGVYAALGTLGARGTQITVRMEILPGAREGTDFLFVEHLGFFVIRNRAAARVLPEAIRLSTFGYLRTIAMGAEFRGDLALIESFRRKLVHNPEPLSANERIEIKKLLVNIERPGALIEELGHLGHFDLVSTPILLDGFFGLTSNDGTNRRDALMKLIGRRYRSSSANDRREIVERLKSEVDEFSDWERIRTHFAEEGAFDLLDNPSQTRARFAEVYSYVFTMNREGLVKPAGDLPTLFLETVKDLGSAELVTRLNQVAFDQNFVAAFGKTEQMRVLRALKSV
ncbi:MAG: hypothetical protein AAB250_16015, partial [Bdellovibrionota bacterium]